MNDRERRIRLMRIKQAQARAQGAAAPAPAAPQTNMVEQTGSGINEGIANALGLPVDAMTGALNLGARGVNAVAGTNLGQIENPAGGSESLRGGLDRFISDEAPQTGPQRFARRTGQEVGAGAVMGPLAGIRSAAGAALNTAASVGSGLAASAAREVSDNPAVEIIASLLGGGTVAGAGAVRSRRAGRQEAIDAVPSVDDLKGQASALYDEAEQTGITASQQQTQGLAGTMRGVAQSEGLISPTGRISTAYPKINDAIAMVDDYAQGTMTPTQMQQVRKTLQKSAQSSDGAESRVGSMMLEQFDGFAAQLAPEFKDANALYSRAMKGDRIDETIELAGSRAGQFSGSGFENALRTEFRGLDRKIIKGQLKGLSDAEIEGIKKVANGGRVENLAREVGKLAPTGVVSAGLGGGIPYMIGSNIGGPGLGALASATSMGAGVVGRVAATKMQSRNAEIAAALARNGGALQFPEGMTEEMRAIVAALMAREAATGTSAAR